MILPSIVEKHTIHGQHQEVIVKLENAVFQRISNRQTESGREYQRPTLPDCPRTTSFMDTSAFYKGESQVKKHLRRLEGAKMFAALSSPGHVERLRGIRSS